MRRISGCLSGCLTKLLLWAAVAVVLGWALIVALNPWALHIGGRSTPLLYWHGTGSVTSQGTVERMDVTGAMFGGYTSDTDSLLYFRLLEWRWPFTLSPPKRGYFDLAGMWKGSELVMNRPDQQGGQFNSGLFVHHAVVTLRWATYADFEAACMGTR